MLRILIAHQADSHESLEFPIRANHQFRANRASRFARITPLSCRMSLPSALHLFLIFSFLGGRDCPIGDRKST